MLARADKIIIRFQKSCQVKKKLDTNKYRYWQDIGTSNKKKKICQNIFINIINKVQVFYEGLIHLTKFDLNLIRHTSNSMGDFVKKMWSS